MCSAFFCTTTINYQEHLRILVNYVIFTHFSHSVALKIELKMYLCQKQPLACNSTLKAKLPLYGSSY